MKKDKPSWITINCGYCFNESLIGLDDEIEDNTYYCPQCGEYQDENLLADAQKENPLWDHDYEADDM